MKVRIAGNSIRFRLKQAEVTHFGNVGTISEVVRFGIAPTDQLSFALQSHDAGTFHISYENNQVTVQVPHATRVQWTNTNLVGFEEWIDTGKGETIKILVEKDFKCLDRNDPEDEDAYPNPSMHC